MLKFRNLHPSEIDVRAAQVGDGWVQLLLYKDARVDMAILDETVGALNWEREHSQQKDSLFCTVRINKNYKNPELPVLWVSKSDCGTESNTEKEKGASSDSFKRACVNWGIGRELYTRIPIFVNANTKFNRSKSQYGGKQVYELEDKKEKFSVSKVTVNKETNQITELVIDSTKRKGVFKWKASKSEKVLDSQEPVQVFEEEEIDEAKPRAPIVIEERRRVRRNTTPESNERGGA